MVYLALTTMIGEKPLTAKIRSGGFPPWETAFHRFVWGRNNQNRPKDRSVRDRDQKSRLVSDSDSAAIPPVAESEIHRLEDNQMLDQFYTSLVRQMATSFGSSMDYIL